jgi:pyrroline-5-carboxylate reductase
VAAAAAQVLLLGAGRMGGALLEGWQKRGLLAAPPLVIEPKPSQDIRNAAARGAIRLNPRPGESPPPAVAVIAVKPQILQSALGDLKAHLRAETTVLSIAAGTRIATLKLLLGAAQPIVRAMPNLPASIGEGITVACAAGTVSASAKSMCTALLEAVGEVAWIAEEDLLDAVTAVSGSGPAYVFLLAECLAAAGAAQGLAPDLAQRLARRTVAGAGALLGASAESASALRESVTSPGGTTEAALKILMGKSGLEDLLKEAVAAAAARARVLGGQ